VQTRARIALAVAVTLAVVIGACVVGTGWYVVRQLGWVGGGGCTVEVDGRTVELDAGQGEAAGLVAGRAVGRGLPARAASIALTVAVADHDLDADELGGSPDGVLAWADETYAAVTGVDGYREREVADVAAEVGGGDQGRYAEHEDDARALASALTGNSPEAFTCDTRVDAEEASDDLNGAGLVPRAQRVLDDLRAVFGDLPVGGFAPEGVSTGHIEGSAHYEGRAVDVFFRPVNERNNVRGWAVAHYLMSQADRLAVRTVIFDDRIWTSSVRAGQGWRDYDAPDRAGDVAILEHRDHVHVDVVD